MPYRVAGDAQRRIRGFTLVELSVVLVVIAVLAAIALSKLWPIQADAERVAMDNMLGGLRSALGIKVASFLARDDLASIRGLVASNPMDLLAEVPGGYRGAFAGTAAVTGGEWYFDTGARVLAYRVRNADIFRGGFGPPAEARFAIVPVYEDRNRNGQQDTDEPVVGVRIESLRPYHWEL